MSVPGAFKPAPVSPLRKRTRLDGFAPFVIFVIITAGCTPFGAGPSSVVRFVEREKTVTVKEHAAGTPSTRNKEPAAKGTGPKAMHGKLAWPVKGRLLSKFGTGDGVKENGITLEAAEGSKVVAAYEGRVGHVGSIPGYGQIVLLEHPGRLVTVYARLDKVGVAQGVAVKRGDTIGMVGKPSANHESASLYFEVRARSKPVDPVSFLEKEG
ncbi:MAG: peptidoglycan DD-metalloendopeptidase family protein [Pseudomonadota bacterium]